MFLDLLRIFALAMMIQGHTFDALLSDIYRSSDSIFFNLWYNLRGFTAPLFIFTAGAVFSYLLFNSNGDLDRSRLQKGVKRAFILIGIGYLLRYPTYKIFVFENVSNTQWKTFFAVDALHLIGAGILAVSALSYLISKFHLYSNFIFFGSALIIFLPTPIINHINWIAYLPLPLADYFTNAYGSLFPLFPWIGYIFAGALLGKMIAEKPVIIKTMIFPITTGIISICLYFLFYFINNNSSNLADYSLILMRVSFIFLLITFFSLFSLRLTRLPKYLKLIARNSLFIYAAHLIAVYGWVFSPGISKFYYRSLSFNQTLIIFLTIFTIIFGLIYQINKFRIRKRKTRIIAEI